MSILAVVIVLLRTSGYLYLFRLEFLFYISLIYKALELFPYLLAIYISCFTNL